MIPAYFDWDDGTIGPYKVESEYKYSEDFHGSVAEPSKHWLYKAMHDDDTVIACFFVNANYVCCLQVNGHYYYYDIYEKVLYRAQNMWDGCMNSKMYPVGYLKTRYTCQSVGLPPAKVIYDPVRKAINTTGSWIPVFDDIDVNPELQLSMYSELIHSEHEYFYITRGGEKVWKDF